MGCDIHLHIEVQIDGVWEHYAHPSINRNYGLFAKMAKVRWDTSDGDPIAAGRGVPDDMSKITSLDYQNDGSDAHSATWFGIVEIMQLEDWLKKQDWGVLKNDLEYGILRTYLFGNSFSGLVRYPEDIQIPGLEDVRFVFWFDN